jgi:hypothetical protein
MLQIVLTVVLVVPLTASAWTSSNIKIGFKKKGDAGSVDKVVEALDAKVNPILKKYKKNKCSVSHSSGKHGTKISVRCPEEQTMALDDDLRDIMKDLKSRFKDQFTAQMNVETRTRQHVRRSRGTLEVKKDGKAFSVKADGVYADVLFERLCEQVGWDFSMDQMSRHRRVTLRVTKANPETLITRVCDTIHAVCEIKDKFLVVRAKPRPGFDEGGKKMARKKRMKRRQRN